MKEKLIKALKWMQEQSKKAASGSFNITKKALQYIRVNDEKNNVSLTNIAMIIVMYKMAMTPATSWQDMTALAIAILGYQAKRVIEKSKD